MLKIKLLMVQDDKKLKTTFGSRDFDRNRKTVMPIHATKFHSLAEPVSSGRMPSH